MLVDLEIADGDRKSSRLALIQEVQHHPLRGDILHVDFHAVSANEKLHAEIPVQAMGEPSGVKNFGGILEIAMHSIEVECLPKDLPEIIQIDVSGLNVGDAIHIKDVQLPARCHSACGSRSDRYPGRAADGGSRSCSCRCGRRKS